GMAAVEGVVVFSFLAVLDWSRLTALPSVYVGRDLEQRQGDCVWYLPRGVSADIYILLMLEHQSTNDRAMALRMLVYVSLLYQRLLTDKQLVLNKPWPVIISA